MASLRAVLASQFWEEEVQSARSLEAMACNLPQEPPPLPLLRSSKLVRSQQLLLLQRFFPLPCIPSYSNHSGLLLDRVIASIGGLNWWATLTGRIRAHKFFPRAEENASQDSCQIAFAGWKPPKCLLDSSAYGFSLRTKVLPSSRTSFTYTFQLDTLAPFFTSAETVNSVAEKPWCASAILRHKLGRQKVTFKAACHEKYVDRYARYWTVPRVLSLDVDSLRIAVGIRYRLGVHHSSGAASSESSQGEAMPVPWGALPGTRARAALSIEKKVNLWKGRDAKSKVKKPYNLLASCPQIALSGVFGGILSTNLGWSSGGNTAATFHSSLENRGIGINSSRSPQVLADMFASIGFTAQFGRFRNLFLDHTKLDARLDIGAASSFLAATAQSTRLPYNSTELSTLSETTFPTIAITLKQQVVGPVRVSIASRFSFDPSSFSSFLRMQELTYGFDCPLESSGLAKFVGWYSPTRREGMLEIRVLEI